MSAITDNYGHVLFSDGEESNPDDFNATNDRVLAIMLDQVGVQVPAIAANTDPSFNEGAAPSASVYAYAASATSARPIPGSANNKIKISAGTLLQAFAAPSGLEAKMLAFTFSGSDEFVIANGDPTNPRVDIVQMKLEYVNAAPLSRDFQDATTRALTTSTTNKLRRVQCTVSVKQGTPAASPLYPVADSGYVLIAGVLVAATYAAAGPMLIDDTAGAVAVIHDQRMPLRIDGIHSQIKDMMYTAADWTPDPATGVLARVASSAVIVPCPVARAGRVIAAASFGNTQGSAAVAKFMRGDKHDPGAGGPVAVSYAALSSALALIGGTAGYARRFAGLAGIVHSPSVGPTVTVNAAGVNPPLWTSGSRCPIDPFSTVVFPQPFQSLMFSYTPTISSPEQGFGPFSWWVAT